LEEQRILLRSKLKAMQAGNWGLEPLLKPAGDKQPDLAAIEQQIAGIETELLALRADSMTLDGHLGRISAILSEPQEHLRLDHITLTLDAMNIKRTAASGAHAATLALDEVVGRNRRRIVLLRALAEKRQERLRRIFQLLSLTHSSADMASAYRALMDPKSTQRASALEFLDNLLSRELAARLLPALERVTRPPIGARSKPEIADALCALLRSEHGWLRVCALYALQKYDRETARACAHEVRHDGDVLVRQTASMVLGQTARLPGDRAVG
jgi:hypothetical protein